MLFILQILLDIKNESDSLVSCYTFSHYQSQTYYLQKAKELNVNHRKLTLNQPDFVLQSSSFQIKKYLVRPHAHCNNLPFNASFSLA